MEVPDGLDLDVEYLRPDHLFGMIFAALLFPLFHPVRAWEIIKQFVRELYRQPPERHLAYYLHMVMGIFLGRYLRRNGIDAIHGHFSAASNISYFAHLASGIPFTFTLYASDDLFMGPLPYFEDKLDRCRLVTTDTDYNERLINLLTNNRFKNKVHVVYSGVNLDEFIDSYDADLDESTLRILSVGSMTGVKGYPTVLEALREIKQAGIIFEYHIVGGGWKSEKHLVQQLIKNYGLQNEVRLLGAQGFEVVRKELDWCNLFIMASEIHTRGRRDGLPTVIIEAMLAKRLVISTYVSDIPNNVMNKKTGLIIPEKSPDQLAVAIKYVVQNSDKCRLMVENANRMAIKKFDENINYKKLAELIKLKEVEIEE